MHRGCSVSPFILKIIRSCGEGIHFSAQTIESENGNEYLQPKYPLKRRQRDRKTRVLM